MAMSGVELDQECKKIYDEVQSKKKHRYVTFKIDDGKIRVDKVGPREADYDAFLGDLIAKDGEADDCRYAIYDFEFTVQTQGTEALNRSKLILISWCPDTAKIKKKMVYSASFDSLKKAFTGVQKIVQANGMDEVEQSCIEDLLQQAARKWETKIDSGYFCVSKKQHWKKKYSKTKKIMSAKKKNNFSTAKTTPIKKNIFFYFFPWHSFFPILKKK